MTYAQEKTGAALMKTDHKRVIGQIGCPLCGEAHQSVIDDGRKCWMICDRCEVQTTWQRRSARDRIRDRLQGSPDRMGEAGSVEGIEEWSTQDEPPQVEAREATPGFFSFLEDW